MNEKCVHVISMSILCYREFQVRRYVDQEDIVIPKEEHQSTQIDWFELNFSVDTMTMSGNQNHQKFTTAFYRRIKMPRTCTLCAQVVVILLQQYNN